MSYLYVMKKKKRGGGTLKSTTTMLPSVAVALSTACCTSMPQRTLAPRSRRLFSVYATSSALNGTPSLQRMPERVLIVRRLKSGEHPYLFPSHICRLSAQALEEARRS